MSGFLVAAELSCYNSSVKRALLSRPKNPALAGFLHFGELKRKEF
jgi:hypothetical protein